MSLLDLTLEPGIPGDVMWSLINGKNIVSVPHHDIMTDFITPQSHAIKNECIVLSVKVGVTYFGYFGLFDCI